MTAEVLLFDVFLEKLPHLNAVEWFFPYALFMSWVNETSDAFTNYYRASDRREIIKIKQGNKLLKFIPGYIYFTSRF